ncbi:MAG TPA: winged helix DNA-binding domain-containing protein [Egibacteraceae bacterium]|nr:winged helix DNA-binding domain-containing protein [Egibacteraceae bacterium]
MLSISALRRLRLRAQRLDPRDDSGDPAAIVRAVGAIQSQDPRAAELALRARGGGFTAEAVEKARVEERSIVRTWCHRGTMHLLAAEDVDWTLRLLGPALLKARERSFRDMGLDEPTYAAALRALLDSLADGPLTRAEIGHRWESAGIDASGYRLPHMITRAALEGHICDGPDRRGDRTWVRLGDWIEVARGPEGDHALTELARRHLAGYGPCEPRDLAAWSGLKVSDARAAWSLLSDEIDEVDTAAGRLWSLKGAVKPPGKARPTVRLLGSFDTYLLGYRDREVAVPLPHTKKVSAGGLRVLPAVTVDGAAVATWRLHRRRARLTVETEPFFDFDVALLADEVADVGRFLGVPASLA